MHDGKCITVFSAPNYCDIGNNKGAFINIKGGDLIPKFVTFEAVQHPKIKAMAYAKYVYYGNHAVLCFFLVMMCMI